MNRFAPILLAVAAAPLAAQEPAPAVPPPASVPRLAGPVIQRGDRVRLHPRSSGVRPVVGRWLGETGGQVRLEVVDERGRADTSLVSLETVALVERSTGRRGRSGAGMGIGAAIGLVVGAAAGFAAGDDKAGFFQMSAGQKALMGGLAGAGPAVTIRS